MNISIPVPPIVKPFSVAITINQDHLKGGIVGYSLGVLYTISWVYRDVHRAHKQAKRVMDFNQRTLKEVWPHLPADVKTKLELETGFFNIGQEEDL